MKPLVEQACYSRTYVRHRPEHTLLYQLVEKYYPELEAHLVAQDKDLPAYDYSFVVLER